MMIPDQASAEEKMKTRHHGIRALFRSALIAATLGIAYGDIMVVHDVVYIDESGAFYLNSQIHDRLGNLIATRSLTRIKAAFQR